MDEEVGTELAERKALTEASGALSKILVILDNGANFSVLPSDRVTVGKYKHDLPFDEIMDYLSTNSHVFVDLWGENDKDENEQFFVRIFSHRVAFLTQSFLHPSPEDSVQA